MIQSRYLIVQLIGKGGMGEVYLAVDQRLGSAVAIKRTFFSDDSTLGSAFEREARILARLRHPVLPKVIDHFAENGDQFLVMEHISGDDLSKRLEIANKPFPVTWVMFWADQMLDALSYLHSHEPPIVHRDIKPQNLKLTDDNHIILLDFGLSKDFDSGSSGQGLNSASVAGYSPHFASMEQIRGTGTDARSDLYSLSATLYQMLTNTVPPDALTRADALLGGKKDPIRPLNEINPEITPAISDVLLKGVSIRQEERFASAVDMQKTLRRAFNKNKPDANAKPAVSIDYPQPPPVNVSTPKPVQQEPETETRIRDFDADNLDATLRFDTVPTPEQVKQSELKTAIFSVSEPAADEQRDEPTSAVVNLPETALAAAAGGVAAPTTQPAPLKPNHVSKPVAKKSSSKAGLIIGVVVGLFVLVGLAGGAGWYLLSTNTESTSATTPTPTPVVEVSPSENPPILADTSQDVEEQSNTDTAIDSNTAGDDSNAAASTTQKPKTTKAPIQTVTKTAPPKAAQTPATAPKGKAKDDRTVILP